VIVPADALPLGEMGCVAVGGYSIGRGLMPEPDLEFLAARGWDMSQPVDICHMDCAEPGYRKAVTGTGGKEWEIILCVADALVLETNATDGDVIDYDGALTPDDSRAGEWPWQLAQAAVAS